MFTTPSLIAVVDDDASLLRSLERWLRALGLRAETFAAASDLIASDHLEDFDCLIVDLHMPVLGGRELAEKLAAQGSSTPVIFITANPDNASEANVLAKPFDEASLTAALSAALGPRQDFCPARFH